MFLMAVSLAEELLNSFAGQSGSWRHCLYFLSNSRNEYVMMYSLTVFEVTRSSSKPSQKTIAQNNDLCCCRSSLLFSSDVRQKHHICSYVVAESC